MNDTLIQDGKYTFLRIETDAGFDGGFELRMITNNQPEMLLKMMLNRESRVTHLDYNVSGLVSLSSCEKEGGEYLYSVISGLEKLGSVLTEYLLTPDGLSLEPTRIFVRKETGQVYFCYVPGREGTFRESVRALMEYFMKVFTPENSEEILLMYGLYQKSGEETVTPVSLAEYLREQKKEDHGNIEVPREEPPEIEFPEDEIYAELGMEKPMKFFGRKPKVAEKERPERTEQKRRPLLADHSMTCEEDDGTAGKRGVWGLLKKTESGDTGKEKPATGIPGKIKDLWKKHRAEVIVAAVVVIGAILILLR